VAGGCAVIALTTPGDGDTPLCWSRAIFGVDCPLCGGLRAVNALTQGNWLAAADHNVFAAILLPIAAVAWAVWLVAALRGSRPKPWRPSKRVVAAAILVLTAFTVVRNLDAAPWTTWLASSTY